MPVSQPPCDAAWLVGPHRRCGASASLRRSVSPCGGLIYLSRRFAKVVRKARRAYGTADGNETNFVCSGCEEDLSASLRRWGKIQPGIAKILQTCRSDLCGDRHKPKAVVCDNRVQLSGLMAGPVVASAKHGWNQLVCVALTSGWGVRRDWEVTERSGAQGTGEASVVCRFLLTGEWYPCCLGPGFVWTFPGRGSCCCEFWYRAL